MDINHLETRSPRLGRSRSKRLCRRRWRCSPRRAASSGPPPTRPTLLVLSVLAGAFISFGAIFATTVGAGTRALPYGVVRLLTGVVFSVGLILVIIGGAELFTGNNIIVMAWASGKVKTRALLLELDACIHRQFCRRHSDRALQPRRRNTLSAAASSGWSR